MKAYWHERPPSADAPEDPNTAPPGGGYVRLDRVVVAPGLAVTGEPEFTFALLVEPMTGLWYGEAAEAPGSALVPLHAGAVVPATPDAEAALAEAAARARATRAELTARTARDTDARFRGRALRAAGRCRRPVAGELVIDLGRAALGRMPPPARWQRRDRAVELSSVPDRADPHGWVEQWEADEDLLVADDAIARNEVARLARSVRDANDARASDIDAAARRAAILYLEAVAPDLAGIAQVPSV